MKKRAFHILALFLCLLTVLTGLTGGCAPSDNRTAEPSESLWDGPSARPSVTPPSVTPEETQTPAAAPAPVDTPEPAPGNTYTVYITNTGEKYHRDGCQYLRKSQIPISLQDAVARGYTPCSKCKP